MKPTTTAFKNWWNAKSELFSKLCATEPGETFTHGDVVLANLFIIGLLFICVLVDMIGGVLQ